MNTHVNIDTFLEVSFGAGLAGLSTVGYAIKNADGTVRQARTTTGVIALGQGDYGVQYNSSLAFDGYVEWDTGGGAPVYAREELLVELAIAAQVVTQIGGQVAFVGPVAPSGDVTVVHADDYSVSDGRQLDWTDGSNTWPTLTGGSAFFNVFDAQDTELLHITATIVTATGSNKKVRAELTAVQTAQLQVGHNNRFAVNVLLSGRLVTLVAGVLHVLPRSG